MSPFITYLLVINAISFVAFAIDYLLCTKIPAVDNSLANALIMDAFMIAGGAVGALLAMFIFMGLLHRHRINKSNVAWWFLGFVCLIVWGLITCVVMGIVKIDFTSIFGVWNLDVLKGIGIYFLVINVIAFAVFAIDKLAANDGNDYGRRKPEAWLLGLCLIGGSVGGMIAMYAMRHKIKKWYFVVGLPLFLVLDIAVIFFLHGAGLI